MPLAVLPSPVWFSSSAPEPLAVLLLPLVLEASAPGPLAALRLPVVVEFPANPRNALDLATEPNAKGLPPRLKLVAALTSPPVIVPDAVTLPATLWSAVNRLAAFSWGTLVVSRLRVSAPPV